MKLYNTLTRKIEDFVPLNPPRVGMYICGPTVYDYMHIGNLRTFLMGDILHRVLLANNYQVKMVQNITDIDDKIIKKSQEKNITLEGLTTEYTKLFFEDLKKLSILPSNIYPKATEHIGQMVKYIEVLIDKGLAYVEKDGSVYFDISKFSDYGKLSGLDNRELRSGTRILSDEYTKDNIQDFALWKSVKSDEFGYNSPWGKGRPGWHIECSVMSQEYLGVTLDIHGGGIDLLFPHHENEIAQSEGKTGKKFANFFIHGEHLLVDGQKMAKSAKNFFTLKDIEDRGFDSLAFRYLTLTAHYRDKLNFTWDSLQAAQNALNNIREEIRNWDQQATTTGSHYQKFMEAVNNDLNVPQALAILHEMVSSDIPSAQKSKDLLEMDKILGLKLDKYLGKPLEVPEKVKRLVMEREQARKDKDFKKSDDLRKEIKKLGYEVEDTPSGPRLKQTL
ncbi:cysteine--tRNA ligase [Candidatus Daviesbacteria bacterium]|nr:cysteine--tRNA ligase [Candidatus Daviesbacteria bacterium]